MDTIVLILILLTAFNFLLKQTFWKPVAVGAAAGIATIFVILLWPYAIEQSKTQIADWLSDNQLMLDTSVVLTLEIVVQMAFCLLAVHVANYSPVKNRMMVAYRLLYWFPGVLIIPVLFFGLLPDEDLRLELFFLTNALVAILGIIATVNGRTAVEGVGDVDWSALTGCVVLFLVGAIAGWMVYVIKRKLTFKLRR